MNLGIMTNRINSLGRNEYITGYVQESYFFGGRGAEPDKPLKSLSAMRFYDSIT